MKLPADAARVDIQGIEASVRRPEVHFAGVDRRCGDDHLADAELPAFHSVAEVDRVEYAVVAAEKGPAAGDCRSRCDRTPGLEAPLLHAGGEVEGVQVTVETAEIDLVPGHCRRGRDLVIGRELIKPLPACRIECIQIVVVTREVDAPAHHNRRAIDHIAVPAVMPEFLAGRSVDRIVVTIKVAEVDDVSHYGGRRAQESEVAADRWGKSQGGVVDRIRPEQRIVSGAGQTGPKVAGTAGPGRIDALGARRNANGQQRDQRGSKSLAHDSLRE